MLMTAAGLARFRLALALLALASGPTLAQSPSMTGYGVQAMVAESTALPDLRFPSEPKELGLFSELGNGLFKPPGDDPARPGGQAPRDGQNLRYPALVLMHTCGGIRPRETRYWIQAALDQGYAVLAVDGLRGNKTNCVFPLRVATGRRIKDAFDALHHLSGLPFVDPARVYVAGFSQGAFIAAFVGSAEVASAFAANSPARYAAAAGFYGLCQYPAGSIPGVSYAIEIVRQDVDRPLLMLMGQRDNETPPAWCDSVLPALKAKGAPVESHLYPEATHCWDCVSNDGLAKTDFKGDRITYRYDAAVTDDSRRRMFEFFAR